MKGVTFSARSAGGLEWTVLKLLALLSPLVDNLYWLAERAEFSPSAAAEHAEVRLRDRCGILELLAALALDPQMIDGALVGTSSDGGDQTRIAAVRGDEWDIYTSSAAILTTLARSIDVTEIPA